MLVIKKIELSSIYPFYHHYRTTTMSMTLDLLAQRVEILEKQIAALMADNTTDTTNPHKNSNKDKKKHTKSNSDDQPPKKKLLSGYILFGKAERDNVKANLIANALPDQKIKSTEVMKHLALIWKQLPDHTRQQWNDKAKAL